eukprot:TRINITY_DN50794_c0_g1_i1.p1 TRINITY_DN50794_c0_g1~~TRINITY_DN50794_c0_g1_i1.p1  ORF type:complete len:358 (+),score=72.91 TRINITY_DN50794_c0_g1_i1:69-1142(+)
MPKLHFLEEACHHGSHSPFSRGADADFGSMLKRFDCGLGGLTSQRSSSSRSLKGSSFVADNTKVKDSAPPSSFSEFLEGSPTVPRILKARNQVVDAQLDDNDGDPRPIVILEEDATAANSTSSDGPVPDGEIGIPKVGTSEQQVVEYWSMEDGPGAPDGPVMVHHKHTVRSGSGIHGQHHVIQEQVVQPKSKSRHGHGSQPRHHHPLPGEDSAEAGHREVRKPPAEENAESDSLQPQVMAGAFLAIGAQAYLWGNVFVTLFKPRRPAYATSSAGESNSSDVSSQPVMTPSGVGGAVRNMSASSNDMQPPPARPPHGTGGSSSSGSAVSSNTNASGEFRSFHGASARLPVIDESAPAP